MDWESKGNQKHEIYKGLPFFHSYNCARRRPGLATDTRTYRLGQTYGASGKARPPIARRTAKNNLSQSERGLGRFQEK
jgi:hypothetical protein